jgi:predicted acyl esterase
MRYIHTITFLLITFSSLLSAEDLTPDASISIPMRDGTELPTDIYFPKNAFKTAPPCLLIRSPSGRKSLKALFYTYLTNADYCVAIQDTRSALDIYGKTMPYWNDGWGNHQDGYDTVTWLAKSPYSNGKVGTLGSSSMGVTQLLLAPTAPPALKSQYIGMSPANLYHDAIYPGGKLLKNQVEGWLSKYAKDPIMRSFICNQPNYNSFWENFDSTRVAQQVKVPALLYTGWYDTFLQGTINAYTARQDNGGEGAKGAQKLVIGPWTHAWPASIKNGDFDILKKGLQPPVDISPTRWFDYTLKGVKNGIEKIPNVIYYVMGPFDNSTSSGNVWREASKWPVPSTPMALYFTPERELSEILSTKDQCLFSYEYDPKNPVPTIGGRNLFLESGAKDQRPIEDRKDVIVFTSPILNNDVEVTGAITAQLFFSSDKAETDIAVRLTDVYPDGRSILIADGLTNIKNVAPNKTQNVDVDLWSTSLVFAKGHRIRVSISSSNYPRFEKCNNGSTEDNPAIARNTLYCGGNTSSNIILPVVRK